MLAVQKSVVDFFEVGNKAVVVLNQIKSLVTTVEDLDEVLRESFVSRDNRAFFVLNSIHRKRLANNLLSKNDFVNLFNINKKEALEKLFITKLLQWHVDELEDTSLTPEQIYSLHKKEFNKPFLLLLKDYKYSNAQK